MGECEIIVVLEVIRQDTIPGYCGFFGAKGVFLLITAVYLDRLQSFWNRSSIGGLDRDTVFGIVPFLAIHVRAGGQ